MKFETMTGHQRSRRSKGNLQAPAVVESLEVRSLMTVLSPTGTVHDATPTIEWKAEANAVSYDLYVADREQLTVQFVKNGIAATNYTHPVPLNLGKTRAWVRPNFAGGVTGDWSTPTDFIIEVKPTVTGPFNALLPSTPQKLNETKPTITWDTPNGASRFEIFFSDQTNLTSKVYTVVNRTPVLNDDGFAFFDENHQIVREEKRSFELPDELEMGRYRIFMRSRDDGGRWSDWSAPLNFEVAPQVTIKRPTGPTFQNPPLLEWQAVPGATSYDVFVARASKPQEPVIFLPVKSATSYQVPKSLANGDYIFTVRARRQHQVTTINLAGTPTSGSYRISLTTSGKDGTALTTGTISFAATAANIQAAVTALKGYENATVISVDETSNQKFLLEIPQTNGRVEVNVIGSISPGTLSSSTKYMDDVSGIRSASVRFSAFNDKTTVTAPGITGPVGITNIVAGQRLVTDSRPVITWTAIDKAARYDVWVHRANTNPTYLVTTAAANSYLFDQDIKPGNYTVWIRAISTTGKMTDWSSPYSFTATGGVPVITSPAAGDNVIPIPDITWTPVVGAKSYSIQIAWLGEDFTYIQTVGITLPTFAPTDPLPTGSYRVWVQAVTEDGTTLPWSAPVDFSVALNENELPSGEIPELLAVLLPTTGDAQADVVAESQAQARFDAANHDSAPDIDAVPVESVAMLPVETLSLPSEPFIEEILEQLAGETGAAEWWMLRDA